MKRTKLSERLLPDYTKGEDIMNMVTHIVGGSFGILVLILCTVKGILHGTLPDIIGAAVYGVCMVTLYTMSSIYHGLHPGTGKKVMQVMDHCTIYWLIAGTYTPILISGILPVYPIMGWCLLALQWGLGITATVLTAIDLKKYKVFSMICYIFMGWSIVFFLPKALSALGKPCFLLILWGGIAYTVGAVLFGIGAKVHWIHGVFHIFVVIGSLLQFLGIYLYIL